MKIKPFSKKVYYLLGMRSSKFTNSDGIEYKLIWRKPHYKYNADGLCGNPELDSHTIHIDPKLKDRRKMSVLIEELTHAFFWDIPEYKVRKFSALAAKLIEENVNESQ